MKRLVLAFFIALLIPAAALASEVRQMPYAYFFEFANSPVRPTFVICNNCPARKALVRATNPIPIAIIVRVSKGATAGQVTPAPARPGHASPVSAKPVPPKPASITTYFDFDSYALRPAAKKKLKAASTLFNDPIAVTGYTDDIGTEAYNIRLSLKRAWAVADYLKRLNVVPVRVIGKGECCPVSKIKKLNRRVEIKEIR